MRARWTDAARAQQRAWLERLSEAAPPLVIPALEDAEALSDRIAVRPLSFRASSRWPGFREASLRRWRKVVVFTVASDQPLVTAFYDARQNLAPLPPFPE